MNFRVRFNWLAAFSALTGGMTFAQDQYTPGAMNPYGPPAIQASAQPYFYDQQPTYFDPNAGGVYCPPGSPSAGLYAELLPQDRGGCFEENSRLDLTIRQMLKGTFFRMEYLHGHFHHSGGRTLGMPIDVVEDPITGLAPIPGPAQDVANVANQFLIIFDDNSSTSTTASDLAYRYAQAPTTGDISWDNAQGIRASFGIPVLDKMSIEASFTGYMNQTGSLTTPPLPVPNPQAPGTEPVLDLNGNTIIEGTNGQNPTTFLVTTLTTDGVPGSRVILYDAGFNSLYESRYLGGNVDLVFNWKKPQVGFRAHPIFGYQHQQYSEGLAFGGAFNNNSAYYETLGVFTTPQTNFISSSVTNQRDLIHLGMRNELASKYLTLGVQEKIGLGSNLAEGSVYTRNLREPGTIPGTLDDPTLTSSHDRKVVFAPSFDLDVYAKVNLSEWFSLRVGYNLIFMGNVGVADKSLRLNEISDGLGGTTPDVTSKLNFGTRTISALTLGGEIILP